MACSIGLAGPRHESQLRRWVGPFDERDASLTQHEHAGAVVFARLDRQRTEVEVVDDRGAAARCQQQFTGRPDAGRFDRGDVDLDAGMVDQARALRGAEDAGDQRRRLQVDIDALRAVLPVPAAVGFGL